MWSKLLNILLFLAVVIFLILLFTQKESLNKYISKEIKTQTDTGTKKLISQRVDSLYNYSANNQSFQITFLEFGAYNCVTCRKMEFVLEDVKAHYPGKVNVVFLNILKPQNQLLMKYYGIAAIPTQVLLDQSGDEFFRHTGYMPFMELRKQFVLKPK